MKKRCLLLVLMIFIIMGMVLAGCSDKTAQAPQENGQVAEEEVGEEEEEEPEEEEKGEISTEPEDVTFQTEDGITIHGKTFGRGRTAVILAHMFPSDQSSWFDVAVELASRGYRVLTFDFRGYGNSGGQKDIDQIYKDMDAAWVFIQDEGADKIILMGASMGGTASLKVAGQRPAAGVVSLSAPAEFRGLSARNETPQINAPKLFLACEEDVPAVAGAQEYFELAKEPKEIMIIPGIAHGTDMLVNPEVLQMILDFVDMVKGS